MPEKLFPCSFAVCCCEAGRCTAHPECCLGEQMFGCESSQRLLQALFYLRSISDLTADGEAAVVIGEDPDKND